MIYSALISILLSVSLLSVPSWYQQRNQFEKGQWLAFASASSSTEAFKKAQALIISQLEAEVIVNDTFNQQVRNQNNSFFTQSQSDLKIKTKSNQVISGLEIIKEERQNGLVYLCVSLHKKRFKQSRLKALNQEILESLQLENTLETLKGNPEHYLSSLVSLYLKVQEITKQTLFLNTLAIDQDIKQHDLLLTDIELKLMQHLKKYDLKIISGNKQSVARAQMLKNKIVCKIQFNDQVLADQIIKIKSHNGETVSTSDQSGLVTYQELITAKKESKIKFKLQLDSLDSLPPKLQKKLRRLTNLSCIAKIYILKPIEKKLTYNIDFQGDQLSKKNKEKIEHMIVQQLTNIGINPNKSKDPDLTINVFTQINQDNQLKHIHKCLTKISLNYFSEKEIFTIYKSSKSKIEAVENTINTLKFNENKLIHLFN